MLGTTLASLDAGVQSKKLPSYRIFSVCCRPKNLELTCLVSICVAGLCVISDEESKRRMPVTADVLTVDEITIVAAAMATNDCRGGDGRTIDVLPWLASAACVCTTWRCVFAPMVWMLPSQIWQQISSLISCEVSDRLLSCLHALHISRSTLRARPDSRIYLHVHVFRNSADRRCGGSDGNHYWMTS